MHKLVKIKTPLLNKLDCSWLTFTLHVILKVAKEVRWIESKKSFFIGYVKFTGLNEFKNMFKCSIWWKYYKQNSLTCCLRVFRSLLSSLFTLLSFLRFSFLFFLSFSEVFSASRPLVKSAINKITKICKIFIFSKSGRRGTFKNSILDRWKIEPNLASWDEQAPESWARPQSAELVDLTIWGNFWKKVLSINVILNSAFYY